MDKTKTASRVRAPPPSSLRRKFDWLADPDWTSLTPFQKFILGVDWNKSPLGPINTWTNQLRQMVLLIVQDPSPAVVYWGDEATIVYNEAYLELIGQKHPALQGQDPSIEFAEVWDHFEKLLATQRETGEAVVEDSVFLLFHRHGYLEKCYFSWKFVPIVGEDGWIVGSHATVTEVTSDMLRRRRVSTVRSLSDRIAGAPNIKELWGRMVQGMEDADKDMPLIALYSVNDPNSPSEKAATTSSKDRPPVSCSLEGTTGVSPGHPVAARSVIIAVDDDWPAPLIRKAMENRTPIVESIDDLCRQSLTDIKWRGHGTAPTQLLIYPIIPADRTDLLEFLIIFLNPHRPYDADYRSWLDLLTQQVTTPQLSAVILRKEVESRQSLAKVAALNRERLFRELNESETKFAKFATCAPIGLAILAPDGTALSANELWRDLTQLEVGTSRADWGKVLTPDQIEPVGKAWDRLPKERKAISIQTKIQRPWRAPDLDLDGHSQWADTEILLSMHPDFDDDGGTLHTVMSCITDISELKWSENQLRKKMDQAIEMKKATERFIDMTSHEMRNPLSALIGCADEIIASLNDFRRDFIERSDPSAISLPEPSPAESLHLISEAIEAADTIIYCAMHQKRIIDDILTLSRLDSNLLQVSPEPCQPVSLIHSSLKMFDAELKRASIKMCVVEEPSLLSLNVSWTLLDCSRVLQVLINLMTNAIKFTRTETTREITVTLGASLAKPSEDNVLGVQYVRKSTAAPDQTTKAEWGDGEIIYLSITVQDTGRGLDEKEIKGLFHLFAQASPKTHQTYGGSGLGLFIARQLVEMQGGEVGVASTAGKGSTFQFYVKTRRTVPPAESGQLNGVSTPSFGVIRPDALREACAVDTTAFQAKSNNRLSDLEQAHIEKSVPPSPTLPRDRSREGAEESGPSFHILVVEDNLVNQKVVFKQLKKAGHVVEVANHGQEALDFLRTSEFWVDDQSTIPAINNSHGTEHRNDRKKLDVILMDLEMPVMGGIECVKRIRQLQTERRLRDHVPTIAVTANARNDQIIWCLEAGMDDVITKPYRIKDMLQQIARVVEKHKKGVS